MRYILEPISQRHTNVHCIKNTIYAFPEMKLRGLVPNSYIQKSVSDLHIPKIDLLIWLKQARQTNPGII